MSEIRTREMLKQMQALPLNMKISLTKSRIREWVREFGENGVYVSFSGGKDSTVLLHLVREMYPNVEAVFCNTGLEFPEIQNFAKSFVEVIKEYGYPMISKNISRKVRDYKNNVRYARLDKIINSPRYGFMKYVPIAEYCDFEIANKCCDYLKKYPFKQFGKQTNKKPFTAQMADESELRAKTWYKHGCNMFDTKQQISNPISFWTENDVLKYTYTYNIPICSVYGNVVKNCDKYKTTGEKRTGCIFCGYGAHHDDRFLRLKETHPKQYNYCINGGEFDDNGIWKPNKLGLGMGHVFDELNYIYEKQLKSGEIKPFIKYK